MNDWMMIFVHIDLKNVSTAIFLQTNLKIDVITIVNKHIDQIIEIDIETIQINQTEQKRDVYEYYVKYDAIDRDDEIDWINRWTAFNVEFELRDVVFIQLDIANESF